MKIVVFGATGNIGQRIVAEALSRGHEVTGAVRDPAAVKSPDARVKLIKGDATDAESVANAARGSDAVINAISPRPNARGLAAPSLATAARATIAGLKKVGVKRLLVVGGAGTLEVAPGKRLVDQPGFPDLYKPEALAGAEAFAIYRTEASGLDWTYFSPAAEIHPGTRTGKFRLGGDNLVADAHGKSTISFEDYAVALIDELEKPKHIGKRFTAAY